MPGAMRARRTSSDVQRYHAAGYDLVRLTERLWDGFALVSDATPLRWTVPALRVRRTRATADCFRGHAVYVDHRFFLSVPAVCPPTPFNCASVVGLTLHELSHLAHGQPPTVKGRQAHHGERFNRILASVADALFGIEISPGKGYAPSAELDRKLERMFMRRGTLCPTLRPE